MSAKTQKISKTLVFVSFGSEAVSFENFQLYLDFLNDKRISLKQIGKFLTRHYELN